MTEELAKKLIALGRLALRFEPLDKTHGP
jgi:hypothetical protein